MQHNIHVQGADVLLELWSLDKDTDTTVVFDCAHNRALGVFYAMPTIGLEHLRGGESHAQRATKSALSALLDLAEAYQARKITLGLATECAICQEFVCSLLYLGFQVAPSRKSPLVGCALALDLDLAWPPQCGPGTGTGTDHTNTGTSDCSTSYEEDPESDSDSGGSTGALRI